MTLIHSDQFDIFGTDADDIDPASYFAEDQPDLADKLNTRYAEAFAAAVDLPGFIIITDDELATLDSSVDDVPADDWETFLELSYVDPYESLDSWED